MDRTAVTAEVGTKTATHRRIVRRGVAMLVATCSLVTLLAAGTTASATPVAVAGSLLFPGDSVPTDITITFEIDAALFDEDPAANLYLATGQGTYDGYFDGLGGIAFSGTLGAITADTGTGTWQASFDIDISPVIVPVTVVLTGAGLLGDQSLPLFTSFAGGTITADGSGLGIGIGTGSVSHFVVPEPASALLVGLGMAFLAVRRTR